MREERRGRKRKCSVGGGPWIRKVSALGVSLRRRARRARPAPRRASTRERPGDANHRFESLQTKSIILIIIIPRLDYSVSLAVLLSSSCRGIVPEDVDVQGTAAGQRYSSLNGNIAICSWIRPRLLEGGGGSSWTWMLQPLCTVHTCSDSCSPGNGSSHHSAYK